MAKNLIQIKSTYAERHTLGAFGDMLAKRQHYLNETAFQSIHATAITTLKSLRSLTRVAKAASLNPTITLRPDLHLSFTRSGGHASACLRDSGNAHFIPPPGVSVRYVLGASVDVKKFKVFEFTDTYGLAASKKYLIAAQSASIARNTARHIIAKRVLAFAGLAKCAISALMVKTNTKGAIGGSPKVHTVANRETSVSRLVSASTGGSGKFALTMADNLRYAARALKGGTAAINTAMQRACNATAGQIRRKCENLLLPGELKTPFPEVSVKR